MPNIRELIKNEKIKKLVIILGVVIIFMIFLPKSPTDDSGNKTSLVNEVKRNSYMGERETEKRLEEILNKVEGLTDVDVMVTMAKSSQLNLAESGSEKSENILTVQSGSGKVPVVISETEPQISGVIITAKGVGGADTEYKIIKAVSSVTRVSANRISILRKD